MKQQDMEVNKIQALVKVGRQIIYMTLLETVGKLPKKRSAKATELTEEATMATEALAVQFLTVSATIITTSIASLVLVLLYI